MNPFPIEVPEPTRDATPASSHWQTTSEMIIPETRKELHRELRREIEQVKGNLLAAAMRVSTLKNRLDGLESQMTQRSSVDDTRLQRNTWPAEASS